MARNLQVVRVLKILLRLLERAGEGESLEAISCAFNVSKRTAYRDIAALQDIGFLVNAVIGPDGKKRITIKVPVKSS